MSRQQSDFVFVHLSDIHFRDGHTGDAHDPDADLRNELAHDLRSAGTFVPHIDAVLVSGDIAFAGIEPEYKFASAWLKSVGEQVSCPQDATLVTPGNHDVNRDCLPDGCEALRLHEQIQDAKSSEERDALISAALRDTRNGSLLFAPLTDYNAFARQYGCEVGPAKPFWERTFPLSDGSSLCIRGISTTIISGPRDKIRPQNLAYGVAQKTFLRTPGIRRVVVGHHPPSWTSDGDTAAQAFGLRNLVQLFGHRHSHWIARDNATVRIIAGAVHPDQREPAWEPRYNVVCLSLTSPTTLRVRVFPRKWSREEMMFAADRDSAGKIDRTYELPIEAHVRPVASQVPRAPDTTLSEWAALGERLAQLEPAVSRAIAAELGLFVSDQTQPLEFVAAAVAAGKFSDLRDRVAERATTNEAESLGRPGSER